MTRYLFAQVFGGEWKIPNGGYGWCPGIAASTRKYFRESWYARTSWIRFVGLTSKQIRTRGGVR